MQSRAPLYEALESYARKGTVQFDVPGHKRGKAFSDMARIFGEKVMSIDINSMPEMDNLNYPTGVIGEAQELMAEAYAADHAFFMVNGSSSSVQAMILCTCHPGDEVLLPRNVHKSAINALILCDAMPVFMQPEVLPDLGITAGITFETAKKAIDENPRAKAIFMTNPTYYGMCGDLVRITEYAHSKGMLSIVDEAHGAHFRFHDDFPESAMEAGADMAAISMHKTGGSLTQSSALLMKDANVDYARVRSILNILQTTSASYLLMASLDIARKNLAVHGGAILSFTLSLAREARQRLNGIEGVRVFGRELEGQRGITQIDETKLGINVSGLGFTGFKAYELLKGKYNVQMELGDAMNVLGIVSVGDTQGAVDMLVDAMSRLAREDAVPSGGQAFRDIPLRNPEVRITPRKAFYSDQEMVGLDASAGRIIAESVMAYPPGIPILLPGELITGDVIDYIKFLKGQKTKLTDMRDESLGSLMVVK
ncbi:MAG: aminotransferase class I/II-fold pyridoxal phosphate-dependent enzyme [Oscillospiraceae bacterium]|nr:aminotransferase class I/II-fold pyridoxal phosphate-dependent enzyme [Oscillospiraceae bacterium]